MTATFPDLRGHGMIAVDVETYDPDIQKRGPGAHRDGFIAGIAIATEKGFSGYYPIAHEGGPNLDRQKVLVWLTNQLQHENQPKIGSHIIYDLEFLAAAGVKVAGPFYDIQNAEPLLDETQFSYSLESIAQRYLKRGKRDTQMNAWIVEKFGKRKKPAFHIWQTPPKIVAPYAIEDVVLPLAIFKKQKAELEKQNLWRLFVMESKLIPLLLAMRQRGVCVDLDRAEELQTIFSKRQQELEFSIKRQTGVSLEPWAARSLAKIFNKLGECYPRTEKTRAPSFRREFLEFHSHPIVKKIHEIRQLDKLRGTFIRNAILDGNYKGKIYCQFNQLRSDQGGTVSGRFSSSNPNLQQVPVRTDNAKLIRSIFIPERGQVWAKLDYSQIEYRLIAHDASELELPGAELVVDAYKDEDADFHQVIADLTGLDRYRAKTVNFGIAYGEGVRKLSASLGLTMDGGKALLREYHSRAPFMKPLSQFVKQEADENGYIRTLLGRVRRFNMWQTSDERGNVRYHHQRVGGAERAFTFAALNARIQGSAADIMKKAMVKVWESGVCSVLGAPGLTVHDELDWSFVNNKAGKQAIEHVKDIMENVERLQVPLKVDVGIGANWGEAK